MSDKLYTYLVIRPVGIGGRVEAGSKVQLTKSEAANYPEGYLECIDEPKASEPAVPADKTVADSGGAGSQDGNTEQGQGTGSAGDQAAATGDNNASATKDHVVTQDDLDTNPELGVAGIKVGDTIQV